MKLKGIKQREGSLRKFKALLDADDRKVHGVFYTNDFFSQRYVSRSSVLIDNINVENDVVKLIVSTRFEASGLREIQSTLDMFVKHGAGDLPGITPEGIYSDRTGSDEPTDPEVISVGKNLSTVDVLLILKGATVTYQDFTIAGEKFTLLNLSQKLEDDFSQTVSILFGNPEKLYFLSHFYNKDLTLRDTKMVLGLLVDHNITGKEVVSVNHSLKNYQGARTSMFPIESLVAIYTNVARDIIFGTDSGYLIIPNKQIDDYRMSCYPIGKSGAYTVQLTSLKDAITIIFD